MKYNNIKLIRHKITLMFKLNYTKLFRLSKYLKYLNLKRKKDKSIDRVYLIRFKNPILDIFYIFKYIPIILKF